MSTRSNKLVLKVFLGVFITFIFSMSAFTCICFNGAGSGYSPPGESNEASIASGNAIEAYIIEGAGYFLNANSNILQILNKVEMAELKGADFSELQAIIDNASYNMKEAKLTYDNLIKSAEATPYNQNVIAKLKAFEYDKFAVEKGLNPVIFKVVKNYLGAGDITGSFKKTNDKFAVIIDMLNGMAETVASNQVPDINKLWKLNQEISQTLLFGQYAAQVFYELQEK